MEEHNNLIVVPWDFTPVASHALAHAVKISRMVGNEISLLHIVNTGISQKAMAETRAHLQKVVDENSKKYNILIPPFCPYPSFNYHLIPYGTGG